MLLSKESAMIVQLELTNMINQRLLVNQTTRKTYGERILPGPDQECKRRDTEIEAFKIVLDALPSLTDSD